MLETRKLSLQVTDIALKEHFKTEKPTRASPDKPFEDTDRTDDSRTKLTHKQLSEYAGTYNSEELLIAYEIGVDKEGRVMKNRWLREGRHFQPPVEDKITTGRFTKRFVCNQAGSVIGLQFSSNRTQM